VTARGSLSVKILSFAFLNVLLLGLVFLIFARVQFRFGLGSFLLAPARDRMLSASRLVGLQLPNFPPSAWNQVLARHSAAYPAKWSLFDSAANQLAGQPVTLPPDLIQAIRRDPFAIAAATHALPPSPQEPGERSRPVLFGMKTGAAQYWVGVRIPIWTAGKSEPIHATLLWHFPSLWTNSFFFDYRPWLLVVLAVMLVSVICWLPLIRGLTRSITQLTRATGQIAEGHFEIQLPVNRLDELGRLSESINRMAHRLAGFVHGQKRFLGDIAHELCSPLARIQVALGILEQRAEAPQLEYLTDLRQEVEHMSSLVHELLSFSKAQISAGTDLSTVNVAETVRRVLQREASDRIPVETDISETLDVIAQPDYLFRSLANIMRNAIRYAGDAGPILVSAKNGDGKVTISVADSGPGLPECELSEIFKPFYRPDSARQRETGGSGLGLAIVKTCIEACGGAVRCRNRSPTGLEVEISLPAASISFKANRC
jgi:two-component system, OmpR family, sensor histidine kinase CpxA